MLQPKGDWRWYYDNGQQALAIALDDDLHMQTVIDGKKLAPGLDTERNFSLEDMEFYLAFTDTLANFEPQLSTPQQVHIALNAVAVRHFHKSIGQKSWYFQPSSGCVQGFTANLVSADGSANVLILDTEGDYANCLLLNVLALDAHKSLKPLSLVRVQTDRLHPRQQANLGALKSA